MQGGMPHFVVLKVMAADIQKQRHRDHNKKKLVISHHWNTMNFPILEATKEMEMKKLIAALALCVVSMSALAATATWTGQSRRITTITSQPAIECQYQLYGQTFWRIFEDFCAASVEVR